MKSCGFTWVRTAPEVWRVEARTLEETQALAGALARSARESLAESAARGRVEGLFFGLDGELGAGKTAFVQGFVAALDPEAREDVTSPTYSIVQEYPTDPPVTHLDLYRLDSLEDLEGIGYRQYYFGEGVVLVEWSARVPEARPLDWLEIDLAVSPTGVREIGIRPHGPRLVKLVERLEH